MKRVSEVLEERRDGGVTDGLASREVLSLVVDALEVVLRRSNRVSDARGC